MRNAEIAALFEEMADLLDIVGENPFRVRAYRNAARVIAEQGREFDSILREEGHIGKLPGIGADLAGKIAEAAHTDRLEALDALRARVPAGLLDLLKVPGLGPKRVKKLYNELKIDSLDALRAAAEAGSIRKLEGFGVKTESHVLQAVRLADQTGKRFLRSQAQLAADELTRVLQSVPGVGPVTVAGSLRRARETIGDIDVLAVATHPNEAMRAFTAYRLVKEVLSRGDTRSSVVLRNGLQVDLRVVESKSYGAALHYFTGSKSHNITIRRLGQQKGLKINEYGVFKDEVYQCGATENEVFAAVDLPWIPPELREDRGEVEAATTGHLPRLVEVRDMRGDLHAHTTASDGQLSPLELAEQATLKGYEYIGVTDHSQRLRMVHGLDERRLLEQMDEIDRVNAAYGKARLLKGIEVDILVDGRLDLPDSVLSRLDIVIGSIHSRFNLSGEQQTERLMRAMENTCLHIVGHPTGRLLMEREAYDIDMERLLRHARDVGVAMELNAHPLRLDLNDVHCRMARDAGVKVAINTDAHGASDLEYMALGVGQARRGWLAKEDVLNTRSLDELLKMLKRP